MKRMKFTKLYQKDVKNINQTDKLKKGGNPFYR